MRIKKDFVLRQVADTWVVLPLAEETVNFSGMLTLNDSGVLLWRLLEQGTDRDAMVHALTEAYEVSVQQAAVDLEQFLDKLIQAGCIAE